MRGEANRDFWSLTKEQDNSIIATAIPKITDQFHSLDDVGWYGSACMLIFSFFLCRSSWGTGGAMSEIQVCNALF